MIAPIEWLVRNDRTRVRDRAVRRDRVHRRTDRRISGAQRTCRHALGACGAQPGQARGCSPAAAADRPGRDGAGDAACRRRRRHLDRRRRAGREGRDHHGRPVHQLRRAAGRRLRGRRYRLRRSDRRARVRRPDVAFLSRAGAEVGRENRSLVRVRLDPLRPRSAVHGQPAPRGRSDRAAGVRPRRAPTSRAVPTTRRSRLRAACDRVPRSPANGARSSSARPDAGSADARGRPTTSRSPAAGWYRHR